MFHRFASALFGTDVEELSQSGPPDSGKEEEDDEDWIVVNYLGKSPVKMLPETAASGNFKVPHCP